MNGDRRYGVWEVYRTKAYASHWATPILHEGVRIISSTRLFHAKQAWTAPVLSDGRAYICQNLADFQNPARLICLDLILKKY